MLKDVWTPPYAIVNTRGQPKVMHEFIRMPDPDHGKFLCTAMQIQPLSQVPSLR